MTKLAYDKNNKCLLLIILLVIVFQIRVGSCYAKLEFDIHFNIVKDSLGGENIGHSKMGNWKIDHEENRPPQKIGHKNIGHQENRPPRK